MSPRLTLNSPQNRPRINSRITRSCVYVMDAQFRVAFVLRTSRSLNKQVKPAQEAEERDPNDYPYELHERMALVQRSFGIRENRSGGSVDLPSWVRG